MVKAWAAVSKSLERDPFNHINHNILGLFLTYVKDVVRKSCASLKPLRRTEATCKLVMIRGLKVPRVSYKALLSDLHSLLWPFLCWLLKTTTYVFLIM